MAKLRHRFPVSDNARGDVPGDSDELKVAAGVEDGVDAGLRREISGDLVRVFGDDDRLGLGEGLESRSDYRSARSDGSGSVRVERERRREGQGRGHGL